MMRISKRLFNSSAKSFGTRFHPTVDSTDDFRKYGKKMVDLIADYHDNIRNLHVVPEIEPGYLSKILPNEAPETPESWESIEKDFHDAILPGVTHWNSPNFYAYYPTANSYAAVMGGMLGDAIGCVGFSWIASPVCTELEMLTMDWLVKMCGLPEYFLHSHPGTGGGVIQGSASESAIVALLAARHKKLQQFEDPNAATRLVVYTSQQSHSSVEKGIRLVNAQARLLETDSDFSLRGETLRKAIEEDKDKGLIPFAVCATFGTTSVCSFDNVQEIGDITHEEDLWLHVDSAYAGSALICPEFRYLMKGIEKVDSIVFNCHKWLNVNFDCSAMFVRNSLDLLDTLSIDPLYLKHKHQGEIPDFRDWQLPLGRRFRSLKLWMVLKSYGVSGLQENIRKQVAQARYFEDLVRSDDRFEIFNDTKLSLVTFCLRGSNEVNSELHKRYNEAKRIHMTPSFVNGKFVHRFVLNSRNTEDEDVLFAWNEIKKHADDMEHEQNNFFQAM